MRIYRHGKANRRILQLVFAKATYKGGKTKRNGEINAENKDTDEKVTTKNEVKKERN
jgi:hypothetical protein